MENNFDNTPDNKDIYTDPNADATPQYTDTNVNEGGSTDAEDTGSVYTQHSDANTGNTQSGPMPYTYEQPGQGEGNTNYQQQYQDNYNYNVGNNTGYNQNYNNNMDTAPMTLGDWLLTLLVLAIPCVGFIMYFVWAFGSTGNISRKNYCRATLIFSLIAFVIVIIMFAIFAVVGVSVGSYYY